ncbi:MAG TPA: lysyl oxidase family protein [Polyangiaceae bacterium]|nr:lysyl oxidase family protein [Polyangiaceae bacterium]
MRLRSVCAVILPLFGAITCSSDSSPDGVPGPESPAPKAGALIRISTRSQVGVLLDEIPATQRDRVAQALLEKPESFFISRAKQQLTLATYRLNFRPAFYEEDEDKKQLPLPPDSVFEIQLLAGEDGKKVRRAEVEGHDYVLADYELKTVVVTDEQSPGISEPALAKVGGTWDEPFVFPVDPELLIQRTGYACMDEAEFPPNSVDSEDVEFFYDQTCEVEEELTPDGCHYTELPEESCLDALTTHVGKVEAPLHYERIAYDAATAKKYRVGEVKTKGAADLEVVTDELRVNRLTYRYIDEDSCALAEACVGGTGWRRLLQFNASEKNVGDAPIHIGDVDYFVDDPENPTPNANHHVYQFSACHNHYHFNYFATFTYGNDPNLGSKRAFCLESVARYGNHESSPTWSPYNKCAYQGITQGWGDQYNAGIECQWVDVTTIDVSQGAVTKPLGLRSNPEGFLCEGEPVVDAEGNPKWESTSLVTDDGEPVDRLMCDETDRWDSNNYGEHDVTLPVAGEGMVTEPCTRGQIGPLRNCGFHYDGAIASCTAGKPASVRCTLEEGAEPQAIRLCEASKVLSAGVACVESDALGSATLESGQSVSIEFKCPKERSRVEPGGLYSVYVAPVWPEDELGKVTCTLE